MITARRIKKYVDELVREFSPERVVMFGSHASGKPQADSDVDLLVVMKNRGAAAHGPGGGISSEESRRSRIP